MPSATWIGWRPRTTSRRWSSIAGDGVYEDDEAVRRIQELFTTATRHKHEIDFTLRHWATPVERARLEDRLGQLMRISRRLRAFVDASGGEDDPNPADEAAAVA